MNLPDKDRVVDIVHEIEVVFDKMQALYHETFCAALYVTVVSANSMGMNKEAFLKHCETLFDNDKKEQLKELQ